MRGGAAGGEARGTTAAEPVPLQSAARGRGRGRNHAASAAAAAAGAAAAMEVLQQGMEEVKIAGPQEEHRWAVKCACTTDAEYPVLTQFLIIPAKEAEEGVRRHWTQEKEEEETPKAPSARRPSV
eukprot:3865249-Rhodomonas_salina.1